MDRLRKYNLLYQKFITRYDDIPFIKTKYKSDINYNVLVEVFDTDYIKCYFRTFEVNNLYAIYIVDKNYVFDCFNLSLISKFDYFEKNVIVVKVEFNFLIKIEYSNRKELGLPIFFRTESFEKLKMETVLNMCLYEEEIIIGSFRRNIVKLDPLKLLKSIEIINVIKFYIDLSEVFIENVLNLNDKVLDINEDYISKVEISLNELKLLTNS